MEFDLEIILKTLASIVGLLLAVTKLFESKVDLRADLKSDLDILEKLEKGSEEYQRVNRAVKSNVKRVYPTDEEAEQFNKSESNAKQILVSLTTGLAFSAWTIWIIFTNFSWWFLLTTFIAYVGFSSFAESLKTEVKESKETDE
ncbi:MULTISPECIES: hypothetical protein [Vibrio]|uniref:hypothetical protein n=1 Tax=Vibrio TaxID=662 RepID=UPI001CDD8CC6|nr:MULTISPECIES: hypothetical protein [Vibrio]MCA2441594.1 hypothetical protein [Vibrio alginolyticus]MDW1731939.1 hypothetical protein [Vibrio sp. Vb2356]MDW1934170.1 hypothetical protein [Vibrio sp. 970]